MIGGITRPMVLSAVSVVGVALLGAAVAAGIAVLVGIALTMLVVAGLVNAVSVLGRLLETIDD